MCCSRGICVLITLGIFSKDMRIAGVVNYWLVISIVGGRHLGKKGY